eukprot:1151749-Pelagomonas_calceolata.AAC.2
MTVLMRSSSTRSREAVCAHSECTCKDGEHGGCAFCPYVDRVHQKSMKCPQTLMHYGCVGHAYRVQVLVRSSFMRGRRKLFQAQSAHATSPYAYRQHVVAPVACSARLVLPISNLQSIPSSIQECSDCFARLALPSLNSQVMPAANQPASRDVGQPFVTLLSSNSWFMVSSDV